MTEEMAKRPPVVKRPGASEVIHVEATVRRGRRVCNHSMGTVIVITCSLVNIGR